MITLFLCKYTRTTHTFLIKDAFKSSYIALSSSSSCMTHHQSCGGCTPSTWLWKRAIRQHFIQLPWHQPFRQMVQGNRGELIGGMWCVFMCVWADEQLKWKCDPSLQDSNHSRDGFIRWPRRSNWLWVRPFQPTVALDYNALYLRSRGYTDLVR